MLKRRRSKFEPPDLSVTCPHCGVKIQPKDIQYPKREQIRCFSCGQVFATKPFRGDLSHLAGPKPR